MGIPLPPPWVLMSLVLGFAGHLQDFKELAGLGVSIVTGRGEDAGCKICDKLVTMMLKEIELDDMQEGGGIDCHGMCFGLGKCVNTCEKITGAMANSTGYPCIAAGLCPELDEFGEVSCKWSYSKMGCEPSSACEAKARFGTPKCELKAGHKQWKKAGKLINDQLNAVGDGLKNRKRCSEEGAGPYCIKDSEGLGLFCEYAGVVMTFFGGVMYSIRAIESPGGDDDRQWLTFWMIFFFFTIFERYADVLLSQTPRYYEIKMVVLIWLMFAEGADKIYRVVRSLCKKVAWLLPQRPQMTEEAYIKTLPKKMQRRAAEEGLEALFASFRCDYDVAKAFDEGVLYQLWAQWNKVDPRYLSIRLLAASDLPPMDGEGATASTDAYAIAYIVPPDPSLPESPLKAGDDPFAVDETPPTGSALTAAAKPASPWAMWASPCAPWNSAKALPAAAAPAAKASLLAAIQAKKSEEKTDEEKAAIMMQKIRRGTLARRAGDAGGTKVKGWGAVRAARRRYSVAQRLQGLTAMPGYAVKAARSGDWRLALSRAYLYLKGALRIKGALQIFRGGPQGQPGQYGGVRSRVAKKSLNPVWKREWMEVRLQGGVMSEDGEYDNPDAPYSWLRLEVWDRDAFTADDFIGEVTLPLCPLMDARSHHYELKLEDPEGKSAADNGVQGSITFELAYLS